MRWSATNIFNGVAIAGVAALLVAAGLTRAPGIDPITTASIGPTGSKKDSNRFMVIDHHNGSTCIWAIHRAPGYDVHRIEPAASCGKISKRLTDARAWQEAANGTVTVTNKSGRPVLRLAPSDGFAYEVVEPDSVTLSLDAF